MSTFLNPAVYGLSLSGGNLGMMTQVKAMMTAAQSASAAGAAQNAYKTAQQASSVISQEQLLRAAQLASKLTTSVQQKVSDTAYMAGAAAAAGARDTTADTIKKYAPWALGGLALAIVGVVVMRRRK